METGVKISVSAHAVILAMAMFGGQLFDADAPPPVRISDVSLITTEEFLALQPPAPRASATAPDQPQEIIPDEQVAILQPEPEPAPSPVAPPSIPEPALEPEPPAPDLGAAIEAPTPMPAPEDQAGEDSPEPPQPGAAPAPSPRVASENNPEAPTDAEVAQETEKASAESEAAETPAEATVEKAPKQSSTEIVTEAEKTEETAAPVRSVRPKSRPVNLAEPKAAPEPEPEQVAKAEPEPEPAEKIGDQIARQIEADLHAALSETPTAGPGGQGQAITEEERSGLILAVQECWSVPVGIRDASDLVVVLAVDLAPNGGLSSSPKLIEPAKAEGSVQQAFEAARRALIACAPYDLPPEKYDTWKRLEVVFNPRKMVLR